MSTYILLLLTFYFHSANIWIEPSWVSSNLSQPSPNSSYEAYLFSAKGEEESFQVHILAEKSDLNNISLSFNKLPEKFPSPLIYQVLPIQGIPLPQGGFDRSQSFFEVLKPFQPLTISKGQKVVLWITFKTPRDIKSGQYKTELQINSGEKKIKQIPITIEVFDFELPETPSLPAISFLDWQTLMLTHSQQASGEDYWKNLFAFLFEKRLQISLGSYLQTLNSDVAPIPEGIWKNYLEQIKNRDNKNIVDITPLILPPGPLETVRNLQPYEMDIISRLKDSNTSLVSIFSPSRNAGEDEVLKRYLNSISEQLPFVMRVLCSPPSPQYNFYTDIWALPYVSFSPGLIERLVKGLSIADESTIPLKSVSSSTTGFIPGSYPATLCSPWHAIDGSPYTGWLSYPAEKESKKEWLEIQLKEKIIGEKIVIIWGPGQTPQSIDILISRDGFHFMTSSVNWRHVSGTLFDPPISTGTFKYNPDFVAIRFEFPKLKKGDIIHIQEIKLNQSDENPSPRIAPVITPWLWTTPEQFPSLRYDTVPIESRMIPWICWNYNFRGIVLTPVISWGNTIVKLPNNVDFLFQPQNTLQMTTLLYPARDTYYSSVRLERLRDGLEDYEYLLLFAQKAQKQKLKNEELYSYMFMEPEKFVPWNITSENFITELMKRRINIGYELSDKVSPYKESKKDSSTTQDRQKPPNISPRVQKNFTIRQKTIE